MSAFRFVVSLRCRSEVIGPDQMAAQLQRTPKFAHRMGASRQTPTGVALEGTYKEHYCSFPCDAQQDETLHQALVRLVGDLSRFEAFFDELGRTGGSAEFFVGWFSPRNSGEVFDHALLERMARLGIDLALDVYCGD